MTQSDLDFKMQAMLDGEISEADLEALECELLENQESLDDWLKLSSAHSSLEVLYESKASIDLLPVVPVERVLVRQRKRVIHLSLLAGAAIIIISAMILWTKRLPPPTLAEFRVGPQAVFELTHSGADGKPAPEGNVLSEGSRLKLTHGKMEAIFGSGVRCVIEAPCDLTVLTDHRISVSEGLAWFHVPAKAVGFTVVTDQICVVDLGTEFGVVAGPGGQDEVHVTKGSVEVASRLGGEVGEKITLKADQARRINSLGGFDEIEIQPSRFSTQLPVGPLVPAGQLGILDLSAHEGINPATGSPWKEGDTYRLIFVTSTERDTLSRDIEDYNRHVQQAANSSKLNLRPATWKVFGSTTTVSAKENTGLRGGAKAGEPIFLVDGETLIATYSGEVLHSRIYHAINRDEDSLFLFGDQNVATGTTSFSGKPDGARAFGDEDDGDPAVTVGSSNENEHRKWHHSYNRPSTNRFSFYAISEPLEIVLVGQNEVEK